MWARSAWNTVAAGVEAMEVGAEVRRGVGVLVGTMGAEEGGDELRERRYEGHGSWVYC